MPDNTMSHSLMKGMDRRLKLLESSVRAVAKATAQKKKKKATPDEIKSKKNVKEAKGIQDALANREIKELNRKTNAILGALSSMNKLSIPSPS